jgi:hypothetical protein
MSDQVKVKFNQPFYGPDPENPTTSIRFETEENLPQGHNGVFTFPADYPLPSSATIVEGVSTFKKAPDMSPAAVTEIKPSAVTKTGKRTKAAQ